MTLFSMLITVAFAGALGSSASNVAQGAPYTLDPPPAYAYSTDPGDATQLTDGQYTDGHFWTQHSTVGWQNARPVVITIDLGAHKPIRGLSYNTAAGVAGVYWPSAIQLFVSDDGKQFRWVGDLVTLSAKHERPPMDSYAVHRFQTMDLHTHGRYVALAVLAEPFTFVDEIEVYEGDPAWLETPVPGNPVDDIKSYTNRLATRVAVQRRLMADIDAVRNLSMRSPDSTREAVRAELDQALSALAELPTEFPAEFKAILPFDDLHARIFRAQALLWEAEHAKPITVWSEQATPKWSFRTPYDPPVAEASPAIRVEMMQNEYRSAAFYVANATQEDCILAVRFEGLPGGTIPDYIRVHEATWTDTRMGVPVEDALPLAARAGDAYHVRAHSGLSRQIWLTVNSENLPAEIHNGSVVVESSHGIQTIPVEIVVHPVRFPDKPRLHFGGWDYTDQPAMYGITAENREAVIQMLREYYVDSPWGTRQTIPYGEFNASGEMTTPPDTTHFDAWIDRWKGASQYCVFAAVGEHLSSLYPGTPEFDRAAKAWFTFWADHMRKKGLGPGQLAVLLFDEPHNAEHDAVIAGWAKPLREASTGIRLWVDPTHRTMEVTESPSIKACDVVCPNRQIFYQTEQPYRDFFASLPGSGKQLEFYSCSGPVRVLDPYSYHRLQFWDCWRYNAKASYFWAFGDNGSGSSWNEYAASGTGYTPYFLDDASVTTSKHMEACREGIEDYEYFALLDDAVRTASADADAALVDAARSLLTHGADVTDACFENKGFEWKAPMDREAADRRRVEILEILVQLTGK